MWTEELDNGKFKFKERYFDEYTGKNRYVSVTMDKNTSQTKKTAQRILEDKIREKTSVNSPDATNLTFGELVDKYLAYQLNNVKLSTYTRNKLFCNSFKRDVIGQDILVCKINARYVREQFDKTGKSNSSKNEMLTRFKALIRWGYSNDYIDDVRYLDKLKPYKDSSNHEKAANKYLETEEIQKLLPSLVEKKWELLTRFLILSGLRVGEAIALEKKSVDKEYIHVSQTYDKNNNIITTQKTLESNRDVYIQPELAELLKEIRSYNKLSGISSIYLFSDESGAPIAYDSYRQYLRDHSIKALGYNVTPHVLRHTHASLLLANGMDIDSIARRLGHANSKVTREIYLHIMEQLKIRDNNMLKNIRVL